jgi:rSAM/selenodomain-associated transferase 1
MVELAGARVVAVLTRAPSSGGKTRLFASLGIASDRRLLDALLLDTVEHASASGVACMVAVTPASAVGAVRAFVEESLAADVEVIAQPDGDLGERMRATMSLLFARGAAAVALIGSDLPHLDPSAIREAFAALDAEPDAVVLGPTADGGYYLVAGTRPPDIFDGIAWSTPRVLEQTLALARDRGVSVHLVAPLDDVDSADSLHRAIAGGRARRTAAWKQKAGMKDGNARPRLPRGDELD